MVATKAKQRLVDHGIDRSVTEVVEGLEVSALSPSLSNLESELLSGRSSFNSVARESSRMSNSSLNQALKKASRRKSRISGGSVGSGLSSSLGSIGRKGSIKFDPKESKIE